MIVVTGNSVTSLSDTKNWHLLGKKKAFFMLFNLQTGVGPGNVSAYRVYCGLWSSYLGYLSEKRRQ